MAFVSWNAQGIARDRLQDVLERLSLEFRWTFLCVQELNGSAAPISDNTFLVVGHLVFCRPSSGGHGQPGLIVNETMVSSIVGEPFFSRDGCGHRLEVDERGDVGYHQLFVGDHCEGSLPQVSPRSAICVTACAS